MPLLWLVRTWLSSSNEHVHHIIHRIFSVGGALGENSTFVDHVIAGSKEDSACFPDEYSLKVNLAHAS